MRISLPRVAVPPRTAALASAGVLAAALAPALLLAPAARAATPCVPAGLTASADADLVKLSALNIAPLGARLSPLAGVTIGHGHTAITPAHAASSADYLTATVVGLQVPDKVLFSHASQTAPPAPAAPDEHFVAKVQTPALRLGVGHVKASAGQATGFTCGAASSFASVDDLAVLPGAGRSLFEMPDNLNGVTALSVIARNGTLGMRAVASAGLADFTILRGTDAAIGVKVITEPTLTGVAGGTLATSSVTYTSPVLDVTLPGGGHVRLDATHTSTDVTSSAFASLAASLLQSTRLPLVGGVLGDGRVHVHLSIGDFTKSVTATAVAGEAATLRLTVSVETSTRIDAPEGTPEIGTPFTGAPSAGPSGGATSGGATSGGATSGGGALGGGVLGGVLGGALGSGILGGSGVLGSGVLGSGAALGGSGVGGVLSGAVGSILGGADTVSTGGWRLASAPATHTSTVLDLGIGLLSVTATARGDNPPCTDGYGSPCGGGGCYCSPPPTGPPSTSPTPSSTPTTPSNLPHVTPTPTVKATTGLPTTGSATVWFLAAGTVLLGSGAAIMRVARRRSAL